MQHLGLLDGAEAADSLVVDLERWAARRPSSHTSAFIPTVFVTAIEHSPNETG